MAQSGLGEVGHRRATAEQVAVAPDVVDPAYRCPVLAAPQCGDRPGRFLATIGMRPLIRADSLRRVRRVPRAAGAHQIKLIAEARTDSTEGVSVLRSSLGLRVGDAPAVVRIDLGSAEDRAGLTVSLTTSNAAVEAAIEPGHLETEAGRCAYRLPIERARCHTELVLRAALAETDTLAIACARQRLNEMMSIEQALSSTPSPEALTRAEDRVALLAYEVDRCPSARGVMQPDGVAVLRDRASR